MFVLSGDPRVLKAAGSLAQLGCRVTYAEARLGAAHAARGSDLAVIDLETGGFSVAKDLKAASPSTVIVMLYGRPHDRWLCKQAGADVVLGKPLTDLQGFTETITRSLDR